MPLQSAAAAQRQRPSDEQRRNGRGRRQRAAQIVDHFPPADDRDPAARRTARGGVAAAEDPRQQLPVAARPAMLTIGRHVVARWKILDDFDVRCQASAREDSFKEVVAQQRAVGHAAGKRRFKRVNIVDALAGVGTLAEEILIDIGDRGGVRIDATCAREDALKNRAFAQDRQAMA